MDSYFPTGKPEKELCDKASKIFEDLLDDLKSKNMISLRVIKMDVDRLLAIWKNSDNLGKAFNEFNRIFDSKEIPKKFSEKSGLTEATVAQIYLTQLIAKVD
jgi:hypothetical protein